MKRSPDFSVMIGSLTILVGIAGMMWLYWRGSTVYATPENESVFLKSYDPRKTVEPFRCDGRSFHEGTRTGDNGTVPPFVSHERGFDEFFPIKLADKVPLMQAVRRELEGALLHSGARIVSETGNPDTGFQYSYVSGKSAGTVSIRFNPDPGVFRNMPLPEGLEDIVLKIEVEEKWFPKDP